jgi:16S rRNA (guanine1516-N2)-methyltransferase
VKIYCQPADLSAALLTFAAAIPGLEVISSSPNESNEDLFMVFSAEGLSLYCNKFKPFNFKLFYNELLQQRLRTPHKELLIQALNLKPASSYHVADVTAGLGVDALILAAAGFAVTMVENNPYLALGLSYLCYEFKAVFPNLNVVYANSIDFLTTTSHEFDVIYLDPMFNYKKKSLAKKNIQLIDLCITHSRLAAVVDLKLFNLAQDKAKHKVIVKRDNKQRQISSVFYPTSIKLGKTVRFDVYQR